MKTNLETMNTPDRNALMGVSMKLKQGLAAIILAIATFSAHATPQTGYYIYDESGHLIGEYDADGNTVQEHIYLGDRPVAVVQGQGGSVGYVTTDQLNTPRVVTDSSQAIEWSWTSDPFGNGQPTGSLTYNLRFPGQYYDAETGHDYNYFRDYDPGTARYVESDPSGLKGGLNTFVYLGDNPVSWTDMYGLCNDCWLCLETYRQMLKSNYDSYKKKWQLCSHVNRIADLLLWASEGVSCRSADNQFLNMMNRYATVVRDNCIAHCSNY